MLRAGALLGTRQGPGKKTHSLEVGRFCLWQVEGLWDDNTPPPRTETDHLCGTRGRGEGRGWRKVLRRYQLPVVRWSVLGCDGVWWPQYTGCVMGVAVIRTVNPRSPPHMKTMFFCCFFCIAAM